MKIRESGMPPCDQWESYFDADAILNALGLCEEVHNVADIGCGYGTFALAAARKVSGRVFALDIDQAMLDIAEQRAKEHKLHNLFFQRRDIIEQGTGLEEGRVDFVMLFNILHCENPSLLLHEAYRVLSPRGRVAVIHWRNNPNTPRGPSMRIRPGVDLLIEQAAIANLQSIESPVIDLPPYHYGLVFQPTGK